MKTLLLLRHAKSDWSKPARPDQERLLNERGERAAARVARHVREAKLVPDLILCSNAVRAEQTLAAILQEVGAAPEVRIEGSLYLASPKAMLALIRSAPPAAAKLLVIGHNPGLQTLALDLVGRGDEESWGELGIKFPTAALAVIGFEGESWGEVGPRKGELRSLVRPRELD